jgi:hypothetical protein
MNMMNTMNTTNIKYLFLFFVLLLHIFYVVYFALIYVKILKINKDFLNIYYKINIIVQYIVCLFLLYKFHPFQDKQPLQKYDYDIIFTGACILAINLGIIQIINKLPIINEISTQYINISTDQ